MTRTICGLLALILLAGPAIPYFQHRRQVQWGNLNGQHYFVVDGTFWPHARPDLQDLRLYVAEKEIPYKLTIEWGKSETEQKEIRILQPGVVGGKTQFLLDMGEVAEYNRVNLKLTTKNFVAHARVEGQDDPHGMRWAYLGTTTLYDLADEKLGHNSTLQVALSTFKFLRVTIDASVKPSDVESGTAGVTRAQKAVWRDVAIDPKSEWHGTDTILTFSVPENVPVERLVLSIDSSQKNFRREIEIHSDKSQWLGSGEIKSVHTQRNGQKIDVDQTFLDLGGNGQGILKAVIHNGDDVPLKISGARLQQYERRIYFESDPGSQPWAYYGDEKLSKPVYDYAKLFQKEANAAEVTLNAEEKNPAYTGRPDDRPWSERHPAVLWSTIIAAVLILGGLALRSIKTAV